MHVQFFDNWHPSDPGTTATWTLLLTVVAIGAVLRFWGLGNIGLHGDEELMAMAASSLATNGSPILPSGMYYGRAFPQLYLMAWSIDFFGESEWSLRLPSAIIGTLAVFIAYWLGRRFLTVYQSVVFALVIALLPSLIALSQTARMYGIYVTCIMLFAVAIFRWERTQSISAYFLAIATCLVALSFHTLTVFSMLLFFYPGILQTSWRLLGYGMAAFVFCLIIFDRYSSWISSQYYSLVTIAAEDDTNLAGASSTDLDLLSLSLVGVLTGAAGSATFLLARRKKLGSGRAAWLALSVACVTGAFVFAVLVQYHLSALAFFTGSALLLRAGGKFRVAVTLGLLLMVLMGTRAVLIWNSAPFDGANQLILTLLGTPSPWSYVIFATFAPVSVIVYALVAAFFVIRFARGSQLPDHIVLFLLAVFAPLLLIGFFRGYLPDRYLVGFLPFFILAMFAGAFHLLRMVSSRLPLAPLLIGSATTIVLLVLFVNPIGLRNNVNPNYADFPVLSGFRGVDHKGASEFVLSQQLGPNDLVMAMDAQQQSYYLGGRLDYYVRSLNERRNSSFLRENEMVNLYTGTPQIATGEELASVLEGHRRGVVLIIGSGELESNRPRYMGSGIWRTMQKYELKVVYMGRDGATKVWRYVADDAAARLE